MKTCGVCGHSRQNVVYNGPIRHGRFGQSGQTTHQILACEKCDCAELQIVELDYSSEAYRQLVDGSATAEAFFATHDKEQASKLQFLGTDELRGKIIADIGAGAGSFLDLCTGMASSTIAIEPAIPYHAALSKAGHEVFPLTVEAIPKWQNSVDIAVCFSVLEHIQTPLPFLADIQRLLRYGGKLILSTPNRNDWLLKLLPVEYGAFFYRSVHPWYFTAKSLQFLANAAGFSECRIEFNQRYDLSNFLIWLIEKRPSGLNAISTPMALSRVFPKQLEAEGISDYIYCTMIK
jgi:2-polyprenyl-3-methyl-5-hydroxy-6-metoxy-1,4-benzoquinol methylase